MLFKRTLLAVSALALAAFAAPPVIAQTSSTPITGDKMPTADQLPPKPKNTTREQRKKERAAAREQRRPEAEAAARNQDFSGGVYNPAGQAKPKPKKAKAPATPASAN